MKLAVALALVGLITACSTQMQPAPAVGVDRPGMDIFGSPITLPAANATLCQVMCEETPACLAWAYGIPNCGGGSADPLCWLKDGLPGTTNNDCRISSYRNIGCRQISEWGRSLDPDNILPEYPRPQLVRPDNTWVNLNGWWQFQPASPSDPVPVGKTLSESILVPFPVESCLSGIGLNFPYLWYRNVFPQWFSSGRTILHFGAVDWQSAVYVNGYLVGNHTGGYDGFSFDITDYVANLNEIIVYVYDPSESGTQPFGKQAVYRIGSPGGDTYTPASGIWQTVWVENVPTSNYIASIKQWTSLSELFINVTTLIPGSDVTVNVYVGSHVVATGSGLAGTPINITIPAPQLWSPDSPYLYNTTVSLGVIDTVSSYFGLRTFTLGKDDNNVTRPLLNGQFLFLSGWLDQGFWPDGIYTAPSDAALAFDLQAVKSFGMNLVRKHQKVEPERWYYWADKLGIVVFQDMIQHYGCPVSGDCPPSYDYFVSDLNAMIEGRYNHPCIVQWEAFNEDDMVGYFNPAEIIALVAQLDPTRLVDTDSGGPANNLYLGDVNDIHDYPYPQDPKPSATQYAMIGEFGGVGAFIADKEWVPGMCGTYLEASTPDDEANIYISMLSSIQKNIGDISACVYTQITDVELECDGFLNYDRTNKFSASTTQAIYNANVQLIGTLSDSPKKQE